MKVYPGADASFSLYSDDGTTYAYEKGAFETTTLHWDDAAGKLTESGTKISSDDLQSLLQVVGGR